MKTNNIFYKVRDLAKKVLPFYPFTFIHGLSGQRSSRIR